MAGESQHTTFCFTDIEGSTRLMRTLGEDAYEKSLERHRELMRAALADHKGREVKTEGDGFLIVFDDASDAIAFAGDAQRRLTAEPWPAATPVRVRMGLHRGPGQPRPDGDYVSLAVHQAARVVTTAHGGQVVVTSHAMEDATVREPDRLERLGRHRLRDFDTPVELLQLVGPGLPRAFPPVRAAREDLGLPLPRSATIGRDKELGLVCDLLSTLPLVTLVGPGGVGKTRLALEAAALLSPTFADGVHLIELSSVAGSDLVASTATATIGARPAPGQQPLDALVAEVGDGRRLLIFDSSERVLDGVADVIVAIGRACPQSVILVTSTEPVRMPDERVVNVGPLEVPAERANADSIVLTDSVRLLLQRARAAGNDLGEGIEVAAALAAIARTLDGIPLALELAAGRIGEIGIDAVVAGLDHRFDLLTNGLRTALPRHRTLEAAVAWTVDLLDDDERDLLGKLSALAGRWPVRDAVAICGVDAAAEATVMRLVGRALLLLDASTPPRLRMLDTIRAYSARLRAPDDAVTNRILEALIRRVVERREATEDELIDELEALLPDVRTAAQPSNAVDIERLTELASMTSFWWEFQGLWQEGIDRLTAVYELCPPGKARHMCSASVGSFHRLLGHNDEAVAAARSILDDPDAPAQARAAALITLFPPGAGQAIEGVDPLDEAVRLAEGSTALQLSARAARAARISVAGDGAGGAAEFGEIAEEALQRGRLTIAAQALINRGATLLRLGDLDGAEAELARGRELGQERRAKGLVGTALSGLASLAVQRGDLPRAIELANERIVIAKKMGDLRGEAAALTTIAAASIALGDLATGRKTSARTLELFRLIGAIEGTVVTAFNLVVLSTRADDMADAGSWSMLATHEASASGNVMLQTLALLAAGALVCLASDLDGAVLLGAAEALAPGTMPLDPNDRVWIDEATDVATAAFGAEAITAARAEGASLARPAALSLAHAAAKKLTDAAPD